MNKYVWGIIILLIIVIIIAITSGKKTDVPEDTESGNVNSTMPVLGEEGAGVDEMIVNPEGGAMVGGDAVVSGDNMMAKTVTVSYNGDEFSPSTVTIKKGDSVKFINTTTRSFSVASNNHPSHTIYPEFDQWKTDQQGKKEFTFKFEKVGTWGYHDHMSSDLGGTVIVQ